MHSSAKGALFTAKAPGGKMSDPLTKKRSAFLRQAEKSIF